MIDLTEEQRKRIVDLSVAHAHFLSISRLHRNQPYNYPCDDEALNTWAKILRALQQETGVVLCDDEKLNELIYATDQLILIAKEEDGATN